MAQRIEDYGLIGDCHSAALVGRDGSIDWLCWPRFDSDACFSALLGGPQNGRWKIAPARAKAKVTRRYRGDSLILETRFETRAGAFTLVDFMPPKGTASDIVRLVVGERGRVDVHMELILRFGYGAATPWVSRLEDGALRAVAGPDMVVLRTPVGLTGRNLTTVADFRIEAGEMVPFVMTHGRSSEPVPEAIHPRVALSDTEAWWAAWSGAATVNGPWRDAIMRSLITLKALTYAPTGGIVAAPTASLPEQVGGSRNWDYRFCWLRDATLTLLALMGGGSYEEAGQWRDWLLRAIAGSPQQVQIMYGIGGERRLFEWEAGWLDGYEGSKPVRIGNAAFSQLQLDVFGEVMDALHQARRGGLPGSDSSWFVQRKLLEHLESVWQEADEGIWEVRGPRQHFTYSKVMAWVAFDRGVKAIEQFGLDGPVVRWRRLRDRIHRDVCAKAVDRRRGCFVQAYGSRHLDASLLLLPQLGFLPIEDRRVQATLRAIEQDLVVDGFVQRYDTARTDDGLPAGEGAFLACSFWLADAYVLCGREEEGRQLFERLLAVRNDLGLLAEEYEPRAKRQVGNFPQAFSHVALVNTALNLCRAAKPAEQRAERAPVEQARAAAPRRRAVNAPRGRAGVPPS